MYDILSDFTYWLNSNIVSLSDGITILQKPIFLHTFSWDLSLFFILKEWRQFKHQKSFFFLKLFYVIMQIAFLLQDNAIVLLFLHLESLRELFVFKGWVIFWNRSWTYFFFFNMQNIRSNCWIIFLKRFAIMYFYGIIYSLPVIYIYTWFNIWDSFWILLNFSII